LKALMRSDSGSVAARRVKSSSMERPRAAELERYISPPPLKDISPGKSC